MNVSCNYSSVQLNSFSSVLEYTFLHFFFQNNKINSNLCNRLIK